MARHVEAMLAGGSRDATAQAPAAAAPAVVDFVCEEDVRQAIRLGRTITIGERTIVTPAARDLATAHRVLVVASWPRA
jgi:hypothetical protein